MINHNKFLPLAEVCSNVSRRFVPPDDGRVWFINTGDVLDGSFLHDNVSDWCTLPGQAKKSIRKGDILYSEIRPGNGRFVYVSEEFTKAVVSTKFMVLEAKSNIQPRYLYHVLTSQQIQNEFKLIAESRSGTFPQITFDSVAHVDIYVPNLNEQRYIVDFMDNIEKLVKVKNHESHTFEEIAKGIFKSWFVDFDPVRAKAEGRPTGLPPEISDLFPDELGESEIGEIPMGWSEESLYKFCSVQYGAPFKSKLFNEEGRGLPLIRIRDLPKGSTNVFTEEVHPKGTLITAGDLVVGMDGEFRCYLWTGEDSWMNQRICKFAPAKNTPVAYLKFALEKPLHFIESTEIATTVIHLGKSDIDNFRFMSPSDNLLRCYGDITSPMIENIRVRAEESRVLTQLRDTLLPKLISGQLRIPDAEKFLEEAGV